MATVVKDKKTPEREWRVGNIQVSVWANKRTSPEGETFTAYDVKATRRYVDANTDEWHDTSYFHEKDLLVLQKLISEAWEYLALEDKNHA